MIRNIDLMTTFMAGLALWNLLGFVQGFIQREGEAAAIPVALLTALVIIFLPLSRGIRKWTIMVSAVLGFVALILALIPMVLSYQTIVTTPGEFSGLGGFALLGILTAVFGVRAYHESAPADSQKGSS
jgi:cadmium resistance protein CadD (predicted permease)